MSKQKNAKQRSRTRGALPRVLALILILGGAASRALAEDTCPICATQPTTAPAMNPKSALSLPAPAATATEVHSLIRESSDFQLQGDPDLAIDRATRAVALADETIDNALRSSARVALAGATLVAGQSYRSHEIATAALKLVEGDSTEAAPALNQLGSAQASAGDFAAAINSFDRAAAINRDPLVSAQALCNSALCRLREKQPAEALAMVEHATQHAERIAPGVQRAWVFLNLAKLNADLARPVEAYQAAEEARQLGVTLHDDNLIGWALLSQAKVYRSQGRPAEALVLARQGLTAALRVDRPALLYRLQWSIGQLHRDAGRVDDSIDAYRGAVATLSHIRTDVALGSGTRIDQGNFSQALGPLYVELTDQLLRKSETAADENHEQALLVEARATLEQLKTAELDDYFQDRCASLIRGKQKSVQAASSTTAVIYPAILPDRTELLVGIGNKLTRIRLSVTSDELIAESLKFRYDLEDRTTQRYLRSARKLNDWLIAPIEPLLQQNSIDTLVLVPDGVLRTIPIAAFHDGKQFLAARYALAVSPGLTLMSPRPLNSAPLRVLLSGLSEGVQGFPPLPYVPEELIEVSRNFESGHKLLNQQFNVASFTKEIKEQHYTVVHIASHGEFGHDANNTFLLAWDQKFTLDKLERAIGPSLFRGEPIELLTLSACQTAAGDDRAALGLAGIAIKAGARSSLATLWYVNDEASAQLVSEFYSQLRAYPERSKASALRRAQIKQISDTRYRHPYYWSGYLLIGNWL